MLTSIVIYQIAWELYNKMNVLYHSFMYPLVRGSLRDQVIKFQVVDFIIFFKTLYTEAQMIFIFSYNILGRRN